MMLAGPAPAAAAQSFHSFRSAMSNTFLPRIVFICSAALIASAHAAEPAQQGSFGVKSKAGGPLLSRAELRDCMSRDRKVRSLGDDMVKLQAEMDKEKTEVTRAGATLKEQLDALDRTNAEAVNAYNEQTLAFDKRVDAYNAGTPAFNAKVDALKIEREAFAKGCENRRFDEKDEIAIRNGK
jgi:hypothetical protein